MCPEETICARTVQSPARTSKLLERIYITVLIGWSGIFCATALTTAVTSFARWLEKGEAFVPDYCRLLRFCGSAPVADVAASVGIDVRSEEFWCSSLEVVKKDIDEFCRLAEQA